jgi:hypothetical protein
MYQKDGLLYQYAPPREQPHVYFLFQSEDAKGSRRVEIIRDVKWKAMKLGDGPQFWDTKIFVGLRKHDEVSLWRHR